MIGQTSEVTSADNGTVDTLAKTIKSQQDFHKYWMSAIELATKTERDWREDAKTAISQFRSDKDGYRTAKFNILYANIQTVCPAIYNSMPTSDVRARFGEAMPVEPPSVPQNDPQAQQMAAQATAMAQADAERKNKDRSNVSQTIERAISVQSDLYDYDDALKSAVIRIRSRACSWMSCWALWRRRLPHWAFSSCAPSVSLALVEPRRMSATPVNS